MFSDETMKLQKDAFDLLEVRANAARHRDRAIAEGERIKKEIDEAHIAFNCADQAHQAKCEEFKKAMEKELRPPMP